MRAAPDKPPQPLDSEWRFTGNDSYEVRSADASSGKPGQVLIFRRVADITRK